MDRVVVVLSSFFILSSVLASHSDQVTRNSLTELALKQSFKISHDWDKSQQDCAGFIRYVFRKAVFNKDQKFLDNKKKYADYLSAKDLIHHNFKFISRDDFSKVKAGDVFVFYRDNVRINSSWHLMLATKDLLKRSKRTLLIYHNGQTGIKAGIKKVWLDELASYHGGAFSLLSQNINYKGFYRWNGYE